MKISNLDIAKKVIYKYKRILMVGKINSYHFNKLYQNLLYLF